MRISDWSSDVCSSDLGFLLIAPSTWSPSVQDLVLAQRHNVTLACIGERSLHPRVIAIQEREPLIATWLERHRCNAALVRPAHVVFGTSAHLTGPSDLLTSLTGALGHKAPNGKAGHDRQQARCYPPPLPHHC